MPIWWWWEGEASFLPVDQDVMPIQPIDPQDDCVVGESGHIQDEFFPMTMLREQEP